MLDIMTLMGSMQLQSEMGALRKETGSIIQNTDETPQEPSTFQVLMEQAATTPLGEAVCQMAAETASALSLESDEKETEKTADGWFDFPVNLDLTVPKAPERK